MGETALLIQQYIVASQKITVFRAFGTGTAGERGAVYNTGIVRTGGQQKIPAAVLGIFGDDAASVVTENAWLFACCYEQQNALGGADSPINLTPVSESDKQDLAVRVANGTTVTLRVSTTKGTLAFTVQEGVTVTVDGTAYTPDENGKITVTVNPNTTFTIAYTSAEQDSTTVHFTCVTPAA